MFIGILIALVFFVATPVLADDFFVNRDRTVADLHSGLIWQGNSSTSLSAESALQFCENSASSGVYAWRLPTHSELADLYLRIHNASPAIYWSVDDVNGQRDVYCFGDGASFLPRTNLEAHVRCVASNPYAAVVEAVHKWADSWQNADIDNYIASYARDFRPQGGITYTDWIGQRRSRFRKSGSISISLHTEEINALNRQQVEIVFQQDYVSSTYQDSVRKRLLLSQQQGRWLITREEQLSSLPYQGLSVTSSLYR